MRKHPMFFVISVFVVFLAVFGSHALEKINPPAIEELEKEINKKGDWDSTPSRELVIGVECLFDSKKEDIGYRILYLRFYPIIFSGGNVTEKDTIKSKGEIALRYSVKYQQEEYKIECDQNGKCHVHYYNVEHKQEYGYVVNINPRDGAFFILMLGKDEELRPFEDKRNKIQAITKEIWQRDCANKYPKESK